MSIPALPRHLLRLLLCLAATAVGGGCKDAPTTPLTMEMVAGGQGWMAVASPADLPTAGTWVPYLEQDERAGRAAANRVRALQRESEQARVRGQFRRSLELRREAGRVAVSALPRPPAAAVHAAAAAIDRWLGQVDALGGERVLLMRATLDSVRAARVGAETALREGDTLLAAGKLMAAADEIRRWSPEEIAWRVLARAEQGVHLLPEQAPERSRARHLARSARLALSRGESVRALQRALYALQLTEGHELSGVRVDVPGECVQKPC